MDIRRIRNICEFAKEIGAKRVAVLPGGGLEVEFYPKREDTPMPMVVSEDEVAKQRDAFMERITYLSA